MRHQSTDHLETERHPFDPKTATAREWTMKRRGQAPMEWIIHLEIPPEESLLYQTLCARDIPCDIVGETIVLKDAQLVGNDLVFPENGMRLSFPGDNRWEFFIG